MESRLHKLLATPRWVQGASQACEPSPGAPAWWPRSQHPVTTPPAQPGFSPICITGHSCMGVCSSPARARHTLPQRPAHGQDTVTRRCDSALEERNARCRGRSALFSCFYGIWGG